MSEEKKESKKKVIPSVDPELFRAIEEANRRINEMTEIARSHKEFFNSFQHIRELYEMVRKSQERFKRLSAPTEALLKELQNIAKLSKKISRVSTLELAIPITRELESSLVQYILELEQMLAEKEEEIKLLKSELEMLKSKKKTDYIA